MRSFGIAGTSLTGKFDARSPSALAPTSKPLKNLFIAVSLLPVWPPITKEAYTMRIEDSPSLLLNQGRQRLYGNVVGFHVIEANIQELLRKPCASDASWC